MAHNNYDAFQKRVQELYPEETHLHQKLANHEYCSKDLYDLFYSAVTDFLDNLDNMLANIPKCIETLRTLKQKGDVYKQYLSFLDFL